MTTQHASAPTTMAAKRMNVIGRQAEEDGHKGSRHGPTMRWRGGLLGDILDFG